MSKTTPVSDTLLAPAPEQPDGQLSWPERREWFRRHLQEQSLVDVGSDEFESHFSAMPARYWESVTVSDLVWGLETIHGFLKLVASSHVPATTPFLSCRPLIGSKRTRLMLCTWDRHGLLAKTAAALSAVRLNIVHASVYTRADDVVLDEFVVMDADGRAPINQIRMEEMTFLLEGALSEPPRFASVWACSRHKFLTPASDLAPRISFVNDAGAPGTMVRIDAADRLGLLYDILQAVTESGFDVTHAAIETEDGVAHDRIHVTNPQGDPVLDPSQLAALRAALEAALTVGE